MPRISALTDATTIAGADELAIVQSGVTKRITAAEVFAAPPAIGGTTPAAGAFTTVSSTGNATLSTAAGVGLSVVGGASSVTLRGHTGTNTDTLLESRGIGAVYLVSPGLGNVYANINSVNVGNFSSTGLSVTGAVSTSVASGYGFITNRTGGGDKLRITPLVAAGGATIDVVNNAENDYKPLYFVGETVSLNVRTGVGTFTQVGEFLSTGLSVTGALSCSTNLTVTGGTVTTGSTTALSLATSGGTQVKVGNIATAVNFWEFFGGASGAPGVLSAYASGTDTNIQLNFNTKGSGPYTFYTDNGNALQVSITHTASANRYITLTGSNGGNPRIGTSAGSLEILSAGAIVAAFGTSGTPVNQLNFNNADTGNAPYVLVSGGDANIGLRLIAQASYIDLESTGGTTQVRVNHTASATRYITLTGSNGGNPTIGTSAGNLKISSQIEAPVGTTALPTYTFTGAQTTGFNYSGDGGAEIVASGVTQCTFKNNVGLRMLSTAPVGFASGAPTSTAIDTGISRKAAGILSVDTGTAGDGLGAVHMAERTAPSAPATNGVYIYAEDNGAGKTRLMALFATGAAQQIAIEP